MPFARGNIIRKVPISGGIEITDAQYKNALNAKLEGLETIVLNGVLVIRKQSPGEGYTWDGEEWVAPPVDEAKASAEENGVALYERQRKAAKEEAQALAASGKTNEALQKLLELF